MHIKDIRRISTDEIKTSESVCEPFVQAIQVMVDLVMAEVEGAFNPSCYEATNKEGSTE